MNETLVEKTVAFHIEIEGQLLLVENVPARVNVETGGHHFTTGDNLMAVKSRRWEQCPFSYYSGLPCEYTTLATGVSIIGTFE